MIEIGNTVVSLDVFEKKFVCDLSACKGACCIKGDAGAPVEEEEEEEMKKALNEVLPYMRAEGIEAVGEQGIVVKDEEGELTTPLVDGGECAFVVFDETGTAKCAFEQAFRDGKITFPKPVSCHLYPIRIRKYNRFEALNYDRWEICDPACVLGEKLAIPVFRFVKNALIRKYGEEWFAQAEAAEGLLQQEKNKK
jgi:hypothetical protein